LSLSHNEVIQVKSTIDSHHRPLDILGTKGYKVVRRSGVLEGGPI